MKKFYREVNRLRRRCWANITCRYGVRIGSFCSVILCFFYITFYATLEDIMINQGWKRIPDTSKIDQELTVFGSNFDKFVNGDSFHFRKMHNFGLYSGANYMRHSSVTFLGTAKDVASNLPNMLRQIESLARYFRMSRAIFIDGGSSDDSLVIFTEWANRSNHNRTILSLINDDELEVYLPYFNNTKLPREGRISAARNLALKMYRSMVPTTVIIVLDLDIVGFRLEGVMDSFGHQPNYSSFDENRRSWDVICSNGILLHGIYRDTYAFRVNGVNNNHHTCGEDHLRYNISKEQKVLNRAHYQYSKAKSQSLVSQSKEALVEVDSCFGGLAIYRHEAIAGCDYNYRYPEYPYMLDCEHVLFHKCLREKNRAKIVVNTRMKLWYGHSSMKHISLRKELIKIMPMSSQ